MTTAERRSPDGRAHSSITDSIDEPTKFHEVVDVHYDPIFKYLSRRLERSDAADLTAETFATAFQVRTRFDPSRGSERAWLFGIAQNLLSNHRRGEARRLAAISRLDRREIDTSIDLVAERLDADEDAARLARALEDLSPADRDALLLVSLSGLSYVEAAAALAVPVGTLKARIWRIRRTLRVEMARSQRERQIQSSEVLHD